MKIKIGKGTKFHARYTDANPEWTVLRAVRRGVFECIVADRNADCGGMKKLFTREEIAGALQRAAAWDRMQDAHEAFYASLRPGQIVHYHNGFREFIRCEVVRLETALVLDRFSRFEAGTHMLRPIALVGTWHDFDLRPDSYQVKKIREGSLFKPHATNIYENTDTRIRPPQDPSGLPAIVLPEAS